MIYNTEIKIHDDILKLQTGKIANQAESSVVAQMGGTILLVTVATQKASQSSHGMLPLSVFYSAPFYAAGKFPGGFNKRESKPSDNEVIEARLIDRSIRPLFPDWFRDEIQIVVKCLSYDGSHEPSSFAITAVSAALGLSSLPFEKIIAGLRVGEIDNQWKLNPTTEHMKTSSLDLVIAGSSDAILMVECGANEHTEAQITDALFWGHDHIKSIVRDIEQWVTPIKKPIVEALKTEELSKAAEIETWLARFTSKIEDAINHNSKSTRNKNIKELEKQVAIEAQPHLETWELVDTAAVINILTKMRYKICREQILKHGKRVDGRDSKTVRNINIETGILPGTHGSALFSRGETQALVIATLGSDKDAQSADGIHGDVKERFMLHYNFPPYSVGECGMIGAPKRREIGHGRLARRAIAPLLPNEAESPYVIRLVSEITSCNGSSSMATVCGSSLALFDAGIALKKPVAGIAMGLIKEESSYVVLSDILGDEDAYGDMDFKVAGTETGITALQMDIKIDGLSREIIEKVLSQSNTGRMHILSQMNSSLNTHRDTIAENAPKVITFSIKPDKIREVIGKGGSVIKELCEKYQISIDISEGGQVKISATNSSKGEEAKKHILSITKDIEINAIYTGQISKIMDFGAFVTLMPGKDAFLHISEISEQRISNISDHLQRGQSITIKVLEIDAQNRIRVTMKNIEQQ